MCTAIAGAERICAGMSQLGERGAFDRQKLLAEFRTSGDLRSSTLYRTISIVATWEAIDRLIPVRRPSFGTERG